MDPVGKVALVTGGGTGIGRATAIMLAEAGADVAVNYSRSVDEAQSAVAEIEALGRKALCVRADVSDDGEIKAMVDQVVAELGGLDILINSAAVGEFIPFTDLDALTPEVWSRTMAVNVQGTFQCIRAAVPHMKEAGSGEVVNISSLAGIMARGSSIPYCASKAALNVVTRAMARELAPEIRVNAVAPGVTKTRWVEGQTAFVRAAQMQTPMRRVAEAQDVAAAVLSLIRGSDFVTGQILPVDGGLSA